MSKGPSGHLAQLETKAPEENLVRKGHPVNKAGQDHEVELVDQGKRVNRWAVGINLIN